MTSPIPERGTGDCKLHRQKRLTIRRHPLLTALVLSHAKRLLSEILLALSRLRGIQSFQKSPHSFEGRHVGENCRGACTNRRLPLQAHRLSGDGARIQLCHMPLRELSQRLCHRVYSKCMVPRKESCMDHGCGNHEAIR